MRIGFFKRKHALEEKVPTENLNSLKQACKEFGREDLYKPLSWVLDLNIRWLDRNLEAFLKAGRYVLVANVMLYESKTERARKYFEEALRLVKVGSARHRRLTIVLANLDIVSKIARRSWELAGKYKVKNTEAVRRVSDKSLRTLDGAAFTKILVAVDGSKSADRAAKTAVKLAKRDAAELVVLSVIQRPSYLFAPVSGVGVPPMGLGDYYSYASRNAEKLVNEVASLAEGGDVVARTRVLKASSSVVQSITDYAEDQEIDLIVLGTRGLGGFDRLLLGSVSNGVATHARCSVLVVR